LLGSHALIFFRLADDRRFVGFLFLLFVFVFVVFVVFVGVLDVVDLVDGVDDLGAVEVEVEVEVEVVGGWWTVVVTVTDGVVEVAGGQVWDTLMIGSWTGRGSVLGSVPAGTFLNVNCWPPWTVTTTVQPSADAAGIAPRPNTARRQDTVSAATATVGLRLLNTVAYSSRGLPRVNSSQLRSQVGLGGRYWLSPSFAIRNRRSCGCLFRYQHAATFNHRRQANL
jgi:hypothetical protein